MVTLKFYIENQSIVADRYNLPIVALSQDLYELSFSFGQMWDGYDKHVQFSYGQQETDEVIVGGKCILPAAAYSQAGSFEISLYGVYGSSVITTNTVSVTVTAARLLTVTPPEPADVRQEYVKTQSGVDVQTVDGKTIAAEAVSMFISDKDRKFYYYDAKSEAFVPVLDAYQAALKGGYAGTEAAFYEDVAKAAGADAALALKADKSTTLAGYGITDGLQNKKIFSTQETSDLRVLVGPVDESGKALHGGASSLPLHSVAMAEDLEELAERVSGLAGQLADLTCEHVKIVSFTISPTVAELGDELQATIVAQLDKAAATVTLFRGSTPLSCLVSGTTATATAAAVTTDTTFKIVVTDDLGHETTATKTLSFYNGVYTGAANADAGIAGLSKTLQGSRNKTFTVTAGAGKYIYYACPVRYGVPVFKVGGFEGGFSLVSSGDFTNASGYTEGYQLWRSANANLGAVTVTVS